MLQIDRKSYRIWFALLSTILVVLLAIAVVIGLRRTRTSASEDRKSEPAQETAQEKWQEGVVSHNGKNYKYNRDIRSYLLMGIDKDEPVAEAEDSISGGQSDAMFLIVFDSGSEQVSVISINRNTMTKIERCDENGLNKEEAMAQICLQHGYGDGKHYSCSRSVDAVSYLFYNLPISGYLSINMGGIPGLNDAVGGVEVTVLQDLSDPDRGVELHGGETRRLNGKEAYSYLRKRDTSEFDSAGDRLLRQEQYITQYMTQLKTAVAGNPGKAVDIYNSVSEYLVTDADFTALITEFIDYEFDDSRMYTVPGEVTMGEEYEEYYVDDDALYDLVLEVFYQEVGSE